MLQASPEVTRPGLLLLIIVRSLTAATVARAPVTRVHRQGGRCVYAFEQVSATGHC